MNQLQLPIIPTIATTAAPVAEYTTAGEDNMKGKNEFGNYDFGVIPENKKLFAVWKGGKKEYWIDPVIAWQWDTQEYSNTGKIITDLSPISGHYYESMIDSDPSKQIVYVGTIEECREEMKSLLGLPITKTNLYCAKCNQAYQQPIHSHEILCKTCKEKLREESE